jgi:hypothetical protein
MKREEMIHIPQVDNGPIRVLGPVDVESLLQSLKPFVDLAHTQHITPLRLKGEYGGPKDLRNGGINNEEYIDWEQGTELLQSVAKSFNIRDAGRVRMLTLAPKTNYSLHADPDLWRVHIPLITNPSSFVFVGAKMWHLPLGNAYLVKVEDHHLALNAGTTIRIHIVFDYCENLV